MASLAIYREKTCSEARRTRRAADYSKSAAKAFTTRAELQRDLQAADADVSQDTISRTFYRVQEYILVLRGRPLS